MQLFFCFFDLSFITEIACDGQALIATFRKSKITMMNRHSADPSQIQIFSGLYRQLREVKVIHLELNSVDFGHLEGDKQPMTPSYLDDMRKKFFS